jgi:hypothetical protein
MADVNVIDMTPPPDVAPPPPDRPAPPPLPECPGVTSLAEMSPGADGAIHVRGDNTSSELDRFGTFPASCVMGGASGNFVLYSYTMRAAGSLRVSTANAGTTSAMFDTVVSVLSSCIASSRSIACNDNVGGTGVHARHSTATSGLLAANQRVYVLVGGRGAAAASVTSGAFELTVQELAQGADRGPCRTMGEACDSGLQCTVLAPTVEGTGICRMPTAAGMTCVAGDFCTRGTTCIATPGDTSRGTCVMDSTNGGVCFVGRTPCAMGLSCTNPQPLPDATGLCRPTLMANAECDAAQVTGVCATGSTCRAAPTAMAPGRFLCFAAGTRGGTCLTGEPRCETGTTCSTTTPATCRAEVARREPCDLSGNATVCTAGTSCAPDAMFAGGTCQSDGSAPGTVCRGADPRCDSGLTCEAVGGRNICRSVAAMDAPCDWRYSSVSCASSAQCLPGGITRGVCAVAIAEVEPNNAPAMGQGPVTTSGIFRGSITAGDIDCYRITVTMGTSLFVETNAGTPNTCPTGADTFVTVYNPMGTAIATNDDIAQNQTCSRINGFASGPLNNVAAGDYAVCVRAFSATASIASYHVTIAAVPSR